MKKLKLLLLSCILFPLSSWADMAVSCTNDSECIEVNKWSLGIAIGYGTRSNPLKDFNDIGIYVIPTFAYYGDSWFIDNGNLGYTLIENDRYSVNLTTSFSIDSAYFHRWDPSNIFLTGGKANGNPGVSGMRTQEFNAEDRFIDAKELETRRFTYLGGIQTFLYTPLGTINFNLAHDLLNIHQGTEASLKWLHYLSLNEWQFQLALILDWKSAQVVDYYYGVRVSESVYWNEHYQAKSALNAGIAFTGSYTLTDNWDLLILARYTKIADEIAASPLLDTDYSSTYFIGMAYRF